MATSMIYNGAVFVICTGVTIVCSISASSYNKIRLNDGVEDGNGDVLISTKTAQNMLALNLVLAILAGIIVLMMLYSGIMHMYNKVCIGAPPLPGKNIFGQGGFLSGVPGMSGMPGSPMMSSTSNPGLGTSDSSAF